MINEKPISPESCHRECSGSMEVPCRDGEEGELQTGRGIFTTLVADNSLNPFRSRWSVRPSLAQKTRRWRQLRVVARDWPVVMHLCRVAAWSWNGSYGECKKQGRAATHGRPTLSRTGPQGRVVTDTKRSAWHACAQWTRRPWVSVYSAKGLGRQVGGAQRRSANQVFEVPPPALGRRHPVPNRDEVGGCEQAPEPSITVAPPQTVTTCRMANGRERGPRPSISESAECVRWWR
jgi:hypothetical protein